jgi:predicted ATP-grasp superfamily ATP-dependent carboligase
MSTRRRPGIRATPPLPPAIVVGIDCMQGLQTARILAARGVPVIATTEQPGHHATRSRSCRRVIVARSNDALIDELVRLGPTLDAKGVLVPCKDGLVSAVAGARERLARWFHVVLPTDATLRALTDKAAFAAHAAAYGLPVPQTRVVSTTSDIDDVVGGIRYPCVVKPPSRTAAWTSHTVEKAFRVEDEPELRRVYERSRLWADQLLIQQWVPGDVRELYSCNVYYDRAGELLVAFVARKLRQWPVDTGQSSLGEECRQDEVRALASTLFASVEFRGLGYVEVKRDAATGRFVIIEPNVGRPTGRSAIAEGGGVELLATMYCDAAGLPLPEHREQRYTGVKWIHLRRDLQAAFVLMRRRKLTVRGWLRSLRGRKVFAVFSWRDPVPFLLDWVEMVRVLVRGRRLG